MSNKVDPDPKPVMRCSAGKVVVRPPAGSNLTDADYKAAVAVGNPLEELETYDPDVDDVWADAGRAAMEAHDLFDVDPNPLPAPKGLWQALLEWGESDEGQEWIATHVRDQRRKERGRERWTCAPTALAIRPP